jgi:threonine/homoserine/homoserine lactone efflux protein
MRAGARAGVLGALPAIAGVLLGTLTLLAAVLGGAGAAFAAHPALRTAVAAAGCGYLAWLGARLIAASFGESAPQERAAPEQGFFGVFSLQLVNPKGWVMVLTAAAATRSFAAVAVLFAAIPAVCLLLWAGPGSLFAEALRRKPVQAWFDRAMGGLLLASATLLLLGGLRCASWGSFVRARSGQALRRLGQADRRPDPRGPRCRPRRPPWKYQAAERSTALRSVWSWFHSGRSRGRWSQAMVKSGPVATSVSSAISALRILKVDHGEAGTAAARASKPNNQSWTCARCRRFSPRSCPQT